MNADFVPVALKAALVNNPPRDDEGLLYREIARSMPVPQGIGVVNSAGKVLSWTLMFDDDKSLPAFFDQAKERFAKFPDAKKPVAAEVYMKFPSQKRKDVEDSGKALPVLDRHPEGKHCPAEPPLPKGTVAVRLIGRALDKEGKPVADTLRQENYIEDRFNIDVPTQEKLANALADTGKDPVKLPPEVARQWVRQAHMSVLDVRPIDNPSPPGGSKGELKKCEFSATKVGDGKGPTLWRVEGESEAFIGEKMANGGPGDMHEVKLKWHGFIEMNGNRMTRLVLSAGGKEMLKFQSARDSVETEVAILPGGHRIDMNCEVRYGFLGEPAGPGKVAADAPATPRSSSLSQGGGTRGVPEEARRQITEALGKPAAKEQPAGLASENQKPAAQPKAKGHQAATTGPEVPLWGRFETQVQSAQRYANPFTDVALNATFTSPSQRQVKYFGFHDGDGRGGQTGTVWKLRFMPDEVGTWSFTCSFTDGTPGTSGTFRCVKGGARPGPLRVDPENPRWFQFADGSRKHLHGYLYLDYWSDFDDVWKERVHDIILGDGYTLVMPTTYIRGPETKGAGGLGQDIQRTYAWVTRGDMVEWDRFDLATWKRLDQRLAWAAEHDLLVYTFDGFFPNMSNDGPPRKVPPHKEDLYLRYTLARHAPFWNVLWNVGFESWEQYSPAQVKAWAARVKELDPWKHPVTWHDQGAGPSLTAEQRAAWNHADPAADYGSLQAEFRTARPAYDFVLENYFKKPVFACECNWEQLQDIYNKPRNRTEVRRGIWSISLAGAISMYADWTADYDPTQGKTTRHYGHGKGRADVKRMNRFLSGIPWWTMAPHTELVADADDVCLAAIGQRYVVYSEQGDAIRLELAAGTYEGEWFNPVDGATPAAVPIGRFSWDGGKRNFNCPNAGDWVLHLHATSK